jgi:hypothetical protein
MWMSLNVHSDCPFPIPGASYLNRSPLPLEHCSLSGLPHDKGLVDDVEADDDEVLAALRRTQQQLHDCVSLAPIFFSRHFFSSTHLMKDGGAVHAI